MLALASPARRAAHWVGNDVVDLASAGEPPPHVRFRLRVLCEREQRDLASRHEDAAFWRYFAAKEAAYKLFVKAEGRALPLEYRRFEVDAELRHARTPFGTCQLSVSAEAEHVHATAWLTEPPLQHRVALRPEGNDESLAVRRLAVDMAASHLGIEATRLSVRRAADATRWDGAKPPQLFVGAKPLKMDLSLSHHGRFVAVTLGQPLTGAGS